MTRRVGLDDENEFAFWRLGEGIAASTRPRVLIAHKDKPIGTSLSLLVSGKGYEAVYACDKATVRAYLERWRPHALLFDTRLDSASGYQFVQAIRSDLSIAKPLILAMSNIWPLDSISALRQAGFDGHCRRPCSLWRIVDLLDGYFIETAARRARP